MKYTEVTYIDQKETAVSLLEVLKLLSREVLQDSGPVSADRKEVSTQQPDATVEHVRVCWTSLQISEAGTASDSLPCRSCKYSLTLLRSHALPVEHDSTGQMSALPLQQSLETPQPRGANSALGQLLIELMEELGNTRQK